MATGRAAADVAFLTSFGTATMTKLKLLRMRYLPRGSVALATDESVYDAG
jgi:hypothetical protein